MRRLHLALLILGLLACSLLIPGCRTAQVSARRRSKEVVRVAGRGCCVSSLHALTDAYPGNGDVEFEFVSSVECADSPQEVAAGRIDLAVVEQGLQTADYKSGLRHVPLMRDHLAVAVNSAAEVHGLTVDQLRGVLTGRYANWSEVGGADLPIIVLDCVEEEPAKRVLRRTVLGDASVTPRAVTLFYEEDIAAGISRTPGSIGCISEGYAHVLGLQAEVVRITNSPGAPDFSESDYSSTRIVGMVYSAGARPVVRDFIEWASGEQAAGVLEKEGFEAASPAR